MLGWFAAVDDKLNFLYEFGEEIAGNLAGLFQVLDFLLVLCHKALIKKV
jgi:hypothetical protein